MNLYDHQVATNLIYHQICRGVKFGEYKFDSDEKMADLAAKQYYIEFGTDISGSKIMPAVPQWVPDRVLSKKSPSKWAALIVDRNKQEEHVRGRWEPLMVKDHIVNRARLHWSILISIFYKISHLVKNRILRKFACKNSHFAKIRNISHRFANTF